MLVTVEYFGVYRFQRNEAQISRQKRKTTFRKGIA